MVATTWTARTSGTAARNGTTSHSIPTPNGSSTPAGAFLMIVVAGSVTNSTAASGWTERLSPLNSCELSVFTKDSATAGEASLAITHGSSNFPVIYESFEFAPGTQWVAGTSATPASPGNASSAFSALAGLTSVEFYYAALCRGVAGTAGSMSCVWSAGVTESTDSYEPKATTDGVYFTSAYVVDSGLTTWTPPNRTITASSASETADEQRVWFGLSVPQLMAEYGFSDGTDSSGNSRNATATGTPLTAGGGHTGDGYLVNATNYYQSNVGPNVSQNDWTVMMWVKRTATGSHAYKALFSNNNNFYFEFAGTSEATLAIECYSGAGSHPIYVGPGGSISAPLDTWTHVAATRNAAGTSYVYVNGAIVATGNGNAANFGTGTWKIGGASGTTSDYYFLGVIDDFRAFDSALDANAITYWKNKPVGASGPALVSFSGGITWAGSFAENGPAKTSFSGNLTWAGTFAENGPAKIKFSSAITWAGFFRVGLQLYTTFEELRSAGYTGTLADMHRKNLLDLFGLTSSTKSVMDLEFEYRRSIGQTGTVMDMRAQDA